MRERDVGVLRRGDVAGRVRRVEAPVCLAAAVRAQRRGDQQVVKEAARVPCRALPHSLDSASCCCCCSAPSLAGTVYCALAKLDIGVQVAVVVEEGEVASGDGGRREHNHIPWR